MAANRAAASTARTLTCHAPQRGLLPDMHIAEPAGWGHRRPTVPQGWTITAIATDLQIPRQTLVLPNGDILVAEGRGGGAPVLTPKDYIAGYHQVEGHHAVKGGDRLTLLRDADGDGTYEGRWVYARISMRPTAWPSIGNRLYVANQDALVRFDYTAGETRAAAAPVTVTRLPSAINHHWTKSLAADRRRPLPLRGHRLQQQHRRARHGGRGRPGDGLAGGRRPPALSRPFATGLRNPTALAFEPGSGQLWAVVNERDELGPDLVPDYLTSVREGAFYGWPYAYWGPNADPRVAPQDAQKVQATVRPDYALQSHSAPLGLAFARPAAVTAPSPRAPSSACTAAGTATSRWATR